MMVRCLPKNDANKLNNLLGPGVMHFPKSIHLAGGDVCEGGLGLGMQQRLARVTKKLLARGGMARAVMYRGPPTAPEASPSLSPL